jgi:transposase
MDIDSIKRTIADLWPHLNERQRRILAATQANAIGHGGIAIVSDICGLSRVAITKGIKELNEETLEEGRLRNPGPGRPSLLSIDPDILSDLNRILGESTKGDPESLLSWTFKSTCKIAEELTQKGHKISHFKVMRLLHDQGYRLLSNRKADERKQQEDRDAQFRFINRLCKQALIDGQPALSVDTNKIELAGNYDNDGKRGSKKGNPHKVTAFHFSDLNTPKEVSYGIYDIERNTDYVDLVTNQYASSFAVNSICGWWKYEGSKDYKDLRYLVITEDGGVSNGPVNKLWKVNIQGLANFLGVPIHISHFPPATSKWNNVLNRLFSFIASNRKGEPLKDFETIVSLISHTKPNNVLTVKCRLDRSQHKTGTKVTPKEFESLNLERKNFNGEWNYILHNK